MDNNIINTAVVVVGAGPAKQRGALAGLPSKFSLFLSRREYSALAASKRTPFSILTSSGKLDGRPSMFVCMLGQ
jgi:hypothetical protein